MRLEVKPCTNGKLCSAYYDEDDKTIVVFGKNGMALGYVEIGSFLTEQYKQGALDGRLTSCSEGNLKIAYDQGVKDATKRLEAKKPLKYNGNFYSPLRSLQRCPSCRKIVDEYHPYLSDTNKFCWNCGQALDWSEEE